MTHNRKPNRKNRTFRFEMLDRREMMSATGWSGHHSHHSAADDASLTAYVAPGEDQRLSLAPTERVFTASVTTAPNALSQVQQDVPYTLSRIGNTMQITANKEGYIIKVANHFYNPLTGRTTLTISNMRLPGVGGGTLTYDVTGITSIVFSGSAGVDQFENNTGLTSTQRGNGGNDTLLGGWGTDYLYGGSGNDHLDGRNGNDELYGGANGPVPFGGGAGGFGDRLFGGNGNDKLDGGEGIDHTMDGGAGFDTAVNPEPGEKLSGFERVTTASAMGTSNENQVTLNSQGRLVIQGGSAADTVAVNLVSGKVKVTFNGQQMEFAAASVKALEFHGGLGDDTFINNTSIAAEAHGESGMDKLIGGSGSDILRGGDGKDWIEGRDGIDTLYGAGGDDTLLGGAHNDVLFGGDGADHLEGNAGNDSLEGGAGNDGMYGGDGRDFLFGEEGNDWLYGGADNDVLYGNLGADMIYGDAGDDKLHGGLGHDNLYGGIGNDELDGAEGDDSLYGDAGNDRLVSRDGIVGNDKLFGGLGVNVFDAPTVEIKQM